MHHIFAFFRLAASTSKLICQSSSFFWPIRSCPANQLFLVYGDASGCISVNFLRIRSLFAEDVFCTWTRMPHCSRCCGLRLEITSLWITRSTETWRSRRRPAPCLFSHHRRKRSSGARAEEQEAGQRTRARYTYVRGQLSNTHAAWATLATTFFWQRGYRYQSYCSLHLKSIGWHTGFACKNFSAKKKKPDRPPVKIWAMLVEAETFFCLA